MTGKNVFQPLLQYVFKLENPNLHQNKKHAKIHAFFNCANHQYLLYGPT